MKTVAPAVNNHVGPIVNKQPANNLQRPSSVVLYTRLTATFGLSCKFLLKVLNVSVSVECRSGNEGETIVFHGLWFLALVTILRWIT